MAQTGEPPWAMPRRQPTADPIAAAVQQLADALADRVLALVSARLAIPQEPDPWVAIVDAVPGVSRRRAAALGRTGAIAGACRIGRTWSARRSAVEAYIAQVGVRPGQVEPIDDGERIDPAEVEAHARRIRAELGLTSPGGALARPGAGAAANRQVARLCDDLGITLATKRR